MRSQLPAIWSDFSLSSVILATMSGPVLGNRSLQYSMWRGTLKLARLVEQ